MKTGTVSLNIRTAAYFVSILWLFMASFLKMVFAQPINNFSAVQFGGTSTGIIRDIVTKNGQIWLGAENGLFRVTGANTKVYDENSSLIGKGFISDLYKDEENNIWVSEYGSGLYVLNNLGHLRRISLEERISSQVWNVIRVADTLLIAYVGGIAVYDLPSEKIVKNITKVDGEPFRRLLSFSKIKGNEILIVDRFRLLNFNLSTLEISETHSVKELPRLDHFSSSFSDDNFLYIGGDNGVYSLSKVTGENIFFPFESDIKPNFDIDKIFVDHQGKLWMAAGGIFILGESGKLSKPSWHQPIMSSPATETITALAENANGELILSSSQLGLIVFPEIAKSYSYVSKDGFYFQGNIKVPLKGSSQRVSFQSENRSYSLNLLNGTVQLLKPQNKPSAAMRSCLHVVSNGKGEFPPLTNEVSDICRQENNIARRYDEKHSIVFAEREGTSEAFIVDSSGVVIDKISTPRAVTSALVTGSGDIYVIADGGNIYVQKTRLSWERINEKSLTFSRVTCLIEQNQIIYICTNGKGLAAFDTSSNELRTLKSTLSSGSRYIRGGVADRFGYFWLATNKGLVILDDKKELFAKLTPMEGVQDVDFEYQGVFSFGNSILILGDKFSYVFDVEKAHKALMARLWQKNPISLFFDDPEIVKSNNVGALTHFIAQREDKETIEIPSQQNTFAIRAVSSDFPHRNGLLVEYRLKGLYNDWTKADTSNPVANYSSLSPGNYEFQARVVDPRSKAEQPVSSLKIRVLPPFWLTWQAFAIYGIFFLLFLVFCYRRYKGSIAVQGSRLSGMVNEKQVALEDSNSSIKRILQRKQTLFTNVSHELRTPLSLIIGPLEQIKENPDDAGNLERIDLIARNAKRLQSLVNQLLEIERLETIKELPKQAYDLDTTLPAIIANVKTLADLKQQSFSYTTSGHGTIHLLQDSLERILFNLVSNAVKYTAEGGRISVKVSCSELHLVITVSDNGVGMTEEEVKTVFNRFTRLQNVGGEDGVGIGLAVVKERVLANGGWVSVKSQPQQGSRFTVHLPMFETESPILQSLAPIIPIVEENEEPDVAVTEFDAGSSKPVVLIVEDNAEMRTYLHDVLRTDYRCATAKDGKHALEVARAIVPNLIVTDFMMPKMDGLELAKAVREHDVISHIPIVLLTARGDSKTLTESLVADVDCYLTKPVEKTELKLRVQNLLSLRNTITKSLCEQIENSATDCEEDEKLPDFANEKDQSFYVKLSGLLEAHYMEEGFNRTKASELMAMSGRQLHRKMDAMFDLTFVDYLKQYRLKKAKAMLLNGTQITQVAYDVGFSSPSYFSSCFKEAYGATPTQFLESGEKGSVKIGEPVTDSV